MALPPVGVCLDTPPVSSQAGFHINCLGSVTNKAQFCEADVLEGVRFERIHGAHEERITEKTVLMTWSFGDFTSTSLNA